MLDSTISDSNSEASSGTKIQSKAAKRTAANIEKAELFHEDFEYAINKWAEQNKEDYVKHLLDIFTNQNSPFQIKTNTPKTVYIFLPSDRTAWSARTILSIGFKEDKTINLKCDLKCEILVFSNKTTTENLVINMPKVEKQYSSVAVFVKAGKIYN